MLESTYEACLAFERLERCLNVPLMKEGIKRFVGHSAP